MTLLTELLFFSPLFSQNYSRALYFFEVCVTIPSVAVSHIMLEAYKKYLLISLIEGGHRPKEMQVT